MTTGKEWYPSSGETQTAPPSPVNPASSATGVIDRSRFSLRCRGKCLASPGNIRTSKWLNWIRSWGNKQTNPDGRTFWLGNLWFGLFKMSTLWKPDQKRKNPVGKCSKLKQTNETWQLGDMVLKDTEGRRESGGKGRGEEKNIYKRHLGANWRNFNIICVWLSFWC